MKRVSDIKFGGFSAFDDVHCEWYFNCPNECKRLKKRTKRDKKPSVDLNLQL